MRHLRRYRWIPGLDILWNKSPNSFLDILLMKLDLFPTIFANGFGLAANWAAIVNGSVFCLLYNDLFAYYEADCDTNGFCCQGSMSLYISPEPSSLITLAMTESAYSLYESQTAPAPCWSLGDADTAARRLAWAMAGHRRLGGGLLGAVCLEKDMLGMIGAMVFGEEEEEEKVERKQRRDILEEGFLRASLTP